MGGLFVKSKRSKEFGSRDSNAFAERDKVILKLKMQRDEINRKLRKYDTDINRLRSLAKQYAQEQKKDKALSYLRKKKFLENTVNNLDKQMEEIENLTAQLEFTQIEMQVVENLKIGNEVLSKLHKLMSVDDVEKIMEDTKETVAYQKEIDDILSKGLNDEDEEEVEKEFEKMFSLEIDNLPEPVQGDILDDVSKPTKTKVPQKRQEIMVEAS